MQNNTNQSSQDVPPPIIDQPHTDSTRVETPAVNANPTASIAFESHVDQFPTRQKRGLLIRKNVLLCSTYLFLFFVFIGIGLLYVLSESGLVTIPVLSRFYRGPTQTRTLETESLTQDAFLNAVTNRIGEAVRQGKEPPYRIRIPETELSNVVVSALIDVLRSSSITVDHAQLVVTPSAIEATGKLRVAPVRIDAYITFIPVLTDGKLSFEVQDAYLGDLPLSRTVSKAFLGYLFTRDFGSWTIQVGEQDLQGIELHDAYIELLILPPPTVDVAPSI